MDELRAYAAERLGNDEEFQQAVGDPSLVNMILSIIVPPEPG